MMLVALGGFVNVAVVVFRVVDNRFWLPVAVCVANENEIEIGEENGNQIVYWFAEKLAARL